MRVLIIDDNAHHAELAARRLTDEGWKVTTTDDPQLDDTLRKYQFIILDYSMPRMSGLEVLKKLKELDIRVPVIVLTGHGNEIIASEAIKLGAYDYLVKDTKLVYLDRLPSVVREAKSKHELLETNRFLIQELRRANDRLQKLTFTDEMTGIYNYRFLSRQLETEIKRAERYEKPLAVCLIDIDFFKQINDKFGHPSGDSALKSVADTLSEMVRSVDYVGRYAGDEFLIIFPDTNLKDAVNLCERIISRINNKTIPVGSQHLHVTLSIGAADFHPAKRNTAEKLVAAADRCLYKAKEQGRNRVVAHNMLTKRNRVQATQPSVSV